MGIRGKPGLCKVKLKHLIFLCRQEKGLVQESEMKAFQSDSSSQGKPGGLEGQRQFRETREEG